MFKLLSYAVLIFIKLWESFLRIDTFIKSRFKQLNKIIFFLKAKHPIGFFFNRMLLLIWVNFTIGLFAYMLFVYFYMQLRMPNFLLIIDSIFIAFPVLLSLLMGSLPIGLSHANELADIAEKNKLVRLHCKKINSFGRLYTLKDLNYARYIESERLSKLRQHEARNGYCRLFNFGGQTY